MRVLMVDDEEMVLEGLGAYLQVALPELSMDTASDLDKALALASQVAYGLVLLDWHLLQPDGQPADGSCVVQALQEAGSSAPVLVVTGDDPADWPLRVQHLGLGGYVPKSASGATLVQAIHTVLAGKVYLPDAAQAARASAAAAASARRQSPMPSPSREQLRERYPDLTARQAEVLQVLVRGASDKQIARELGLSVATARTHVRAILGVIGVNRRGEAVFHAVGRNGNA